MRVARRVQRLLLATLAALLAAASGTLAAPVAEAGGTQLRASGVATYTLDPERHVVRVRTVYTLVNRAPGSRATFDCSSWSVTWSGAVYVPRTCTRDTGRTFTTYRFWIEGDATGVRVRASSGRVRARAGARASGHRQWTATLAPIRYGRSRRIVVTYDLPASGPRPPSPDARRASAGYASFCASGPTSDEGETRVVVPSGYALAATPDATPSAAGAVKVYASGRMAARPWEYGLCLRGPNVDGSVATTVAGPGGAAVHVRSWRDDDAWAQAVGAAVGELVALADVLGPSRGAIPASIREVAADAATAAPSGGGEWDLTEWATDPAAVSTPIALGAWLPEAGFGSGWVRDGTLAWARHEAGLGGAPCDEPRDPPAVPSAELGLEAWTPPATGASDASVAAWAWKRGAACFIVAEVAAASGVEHLREALAAIREGRDAWSPASSPVRRIGPGIGWRDWLDIMAERALLPAGADPSLASELLATYEPGVDAAALATHEAARDSYHRHLDRYGAVPASITDALRRWDDAAATSGLDAAADAASVASSVQVILPGVETDGGPVERAIRGAASQADLDAAAALAGTQVELARAVAAAFAAERAPRDAIQALGLLGEPAIDHGAALRAVEAVDGDAAWAEAARIAARIEGARTAGLLRAALLALAVVAVAGLVTATVVGRRRRMVARPAGAAGADGMAAMGAGADRVVTLGADAPSRGAADAPAVTVRPSADPEPVPVPPPPARVPPRRFVEPPTAYRAPWPGDAPMPHGDEGPVAGGDASG